MAKKKAAKKKKAVKRATVVAVPEVVSPAAAEKSVMLVPKAKPFTCAQALRCICGKCDPAVKKPAFE